MHKSKMQQKNTETGQLNMFSSPESKPTPSPTGGTGTGGEQGAELLQRLTKQRTLTQHILEEIVDYANLNRAYKQVARNAGSCGVDGMEVEDLRGWLGGNLNTLREALLSETYEVSPVRKVEIPKPTGGTRMLGIPTVKDRLIQQAIAQQLGRHYEPHFSEHSYGFRPGRSAHEAITQASAYISEGKQWVVDIDLEKFFDKINHDRLMQRLSKGIGDKRLLRLINAYLKAGLMTEGLVQQRIAGTPQGGPLSPLLSNIVLDELDRELQRRGHSFCRYADDCNIYVKSEKAGKRVLASILKFIEKKLKLKVNRAKSGARPAGQVKFLGYTVLPNGGIRVADASVDRLKGKIREITKRNRGVRFEQVIAELNRTIMGWTNYFRVANCWLTTFRELDEWTRRKLRCYRLKQTGRKFATYKLLRSLGAPESKSWNVVMYSQGWWNMSNKQAVNQSMNLKWFNKQGLHSFYLRMKG